MSDIIFPEAIVKKANNKVALYSFAIQPCYYNKLKADEYAPYSDADIDEDQTKYVGGNPVTYVYPSMNGTIFDVQYVCALDDAKLNKPEYTELCVEPPKGLVYPDPKQFTLTGPIYYGLTQPAVYNEFITGSESSYSYYGGTTVLTIAYDQMQIYYIPTDPILNDADITTGGELRTLDLHFRGLLAKDKDDKEISTTISSLTEFGNRGALLTENTNRKYTLKTNARFGVFRLRVADNFDKQNDPTTLTTSKRVDNSVLIKMWPRTLPVPYQMNVDGALQRVGSWFLGFTPYPKINYRMRYYTLNNLELLDLTYPVDPQQIQIKIEKINTTVTGDDEIADKTVNAFLWRVSYDDKPYIPRTLKIGSTTKIVIDGTVSKPIKWYILPTNTTNGIKPAVITTNQENTDIKYIKALSAGKFKLVVTDGSNLSYVSSEIQIM